jgi:hypothetical protein
VRTHIVALLVRTHTRTHASGKLWLKPCVARSLHTDRDPTHFRYVLNFLRDSRIEVSVQCVSIVRRSLETDLRMRPWRGHV